MVKAAAEARVTGYLAGMAVPVVTEVFLAAEAVVAGPERTMVLSVPAAWLVLVVAVKLGFGRFVDPAPTLRKFIVPIKTLNPVTSSLSTVHFLLV